MSSTEYIDVPVNTDPDSLAAVGFAFMQAQFPGWKPSPGDALTILIQAAARMGAVAMAAASGVPSSIFRFLGPLVGVNPINATPATVTATATVVDTAGYTIPAGTIVGILDTGDNLVPFSVSNDVVIAPASTTGTLPLVALTPGAAGSGLGGATVPAQLITSLSFVT